MTLSTKDIYNVLKEFSEYGAAIYYALENKKIKLDEVQDVLFKDSTEKINLVFPKFIEKISLEDIEVSKDNYKDNFTRLSCVDRIIERDKNRHQHLREIRNIVYLEKELNKMIKEKNYQNAFNLHFTGKILEMLKNDTRKKYLSIQEVLKLYIAAYELLLDESDKKLASNIDNYYISMITN